ncbi:type IX secretion system sortase PorU [Wenyingzhuangia aestuarii]|uniref:type IX secretion system sortase PorU n=1 Tax=Wenyingzhuangia aestuarii TaxID=1647582 RepID=UPI0014396985|nr:type IX secretion system sortase PorU [Wenyingzhuangia aestuarii]NJB82629.1 hypothetical protein [Wenyingzhuangia aestuarii]
MKLRYLVFSLLSTLSIFSQEKINFTLDWNQVYEPVLQKNILLANHVTLNQDLQPVFAYQFKTKGGVSLGTYNFLNITTKKLATNEMSSIDLNLLPNSFNPLIRIVKEREKNVAVIEANPIYKLANGEVVKVMSFDVSYNITTNGTSKLAKVNNTNAQINSVLSSGTWYKIAVDKSGVFKMDADFLNSIGINVSSINPKQIRVFGNGGVMLPELLSRSRKEDLVENAIVVSGENDNVFNNNDYVLFYAQGPIDWELNSKNDISHIQNIYSNYAYYFINVDSGVNGKRIQTSGIVNQAATKSITTFTDYQFHEKELMNYIRVGKRWFGEDFTVNNTQSFEFDFPNIDVTAPVLVKGSFTGLSSSTVTNYQVFYDDNDGDSSNNLQVMSATIATTSSSAFRDNLVTGSFTPQNANVKLDVTWNNSGDLSALAHLDYLEVIANRVLRATGKQFKFLNFDSTLASEILEYNIANDSEIDAVWNVTDPNNVKSLQDTDIASSTFKFKEITNGTLTKYHVVKESSAYVPIKLASSANVVNQNLHGLTDVQYLIVTTSALKEQAERLANYHRNNTVISDTNNAFLNVKVVELEQIYNEFSSGGPDVTAIRDFAKYLYDNGSSDETRLKYLCLFGDASIDYKGIKYPNTNLVPVYLSTRSTSLTNSYNTDDYYGYLDQTDDTSDDQEVSPSGQLDISTGRIPVKTAQEAKQFVDKTLNYYSSKSFGSWKSKITLLGDDGQEGTDQGLIKNLETSALKIENNNKNLNLDKLYTDAFKEEITAGGGRYPGIKKRFDDAFNRGSLVINYFGHGNVSALGEEVFLGISDIRGFRNLNNLPLFITVTCDFSRFDDPTIVSGGEELIESAYGGAGSMITTSREITIFSGATVNNKLADYLYSFDGKSRTIAEALKDVKNDIVLSNELFVFFFGDPAMKLSLPKEGVVLKKVQKHITNETTGDVTYQDVSELNGLSKLRVTGELQNDGVLNQNFNGELSVVLYDKEIDRKTLLNEAGGVTSANQGSVVEFKSLENKVFVGKASVNNGKFTFDFILPKDVSVFPEDAKFSFYAASNSEERIGSNFDYKVGGIDPDVVEDDTPPEIQLFFEDETFTNGGSTTSTPSLLAKIYDENGINTSLNSIGHNISLVIDGDLANPISLNEFYTTEKDDYTNGVVNYELPELEVGNHTITFKAWDSHNNSATQTLSFFVEENTGFKLSRVLNYPNPFINHTEFWFKNNRQGDPLEIKVQIYTLSGKLIKTIRSSTDNSDEIQRSVTWDGRDDYGNRLGKGVYLYKLVVKNSVTDEIDEKIEKLVIL